MLKASVFGEKYLLLMNLFSHVLYVNAVCTFSDILEWPFFSTWKNIFNFLYQMIKILRLYRNRRVLPILRYSYSKLGSKLAFFWNALCSFKSMRSPVILGKLSLNIKEKGPQVFFLSLLSTPMINQFFLLVMK